MASTYLVRSNRTAGLFEPAKEAERATVPSTPDLAEMIGDYAGRSDVAQGKNLMRLRKASNRDWNAVCSHQASR